MKNIIVLLLFLPVMVNAELSILNDSELSDQTGQTGITLSTRIEFGSGTRISYSNPDASYLDNTDYWLVFNELSGSIELKGLKLDLIGDFGPAGNQGALQWTLPEEVTFDELKTEGIYVGPSAAVGSNHQFLMGVEIDGTLTMPAQTKINIFPVN